MNFLLCLILVAVGEAAYFETTMQQQTNDGFQDQEAAWQKEDDSLRDENKQLLSTKANLLRDIASTQTEINNLANKPRVDVAPPSATNATPGAPIPTASTVLGTITTADGKKYDDCHLLKIEVDGITFSYSQGITKLKFSDLPADLQKSFDVDPKTGQASDEGMTKYEILLQRQTPPPLTQ